ncbi:p53 and DNA damage-regulated protein 1-like isoform X4 [Oratosquilla oratoria]|uniref:p53 and DNA damage-regulated protein 1-like isoform X4 n=1 Tax=Oratosquilla oratoria TaxID=337810 RepID=UPI003F771BBC
MMCQCYACSFFRCLKMDFEPPKILQYLEDLEEVAEEVLSDRQEIINLDRRRNSNREALRTLRDITSLNAGSKTWICIGNQFLRLPKKQAVSSIEKEQKQIDDEIKSLNDGLKTKVNRLNDLENKEAYRGTDLKPLNAEEWNAVKQVLG